MGRKPAQALLAAGLAALILAPSHAQQQQWSRLSTDVRLTARFGHAASQNGSHIAWLGGRTDDGTLAPLSAFTVSTRAVQETSRVLPLDRAATTTDAAGRLWSIGGYDANGVETNGVWVYTPSTGIWAQKPVTGTQPVPRKLATASYLSNCNATTDCIVLFGGSNSAGARLGDVWFLFGLNNPTAVWQQNSNAGSPSARHSAVSAASPDGTQFLVYGGDTAAGASPDMFALAAAGFADATPSEMINLASGMGAYTKQSSNYSTNNLAAKAVDGNAGTAFGNQCSHTNTTLQQFPPNNIAWWRIDLGSVKQIDMVRIWARTDCCAGRNAGFQVWFSLNENALPWDNPALTGGVNSNHGFPDITNSNAAIRTNIKSRFVWVYLPGQLRILTLCEVEIFQKTPWTWRTLSGLYNAALNKVAWQSSRDLLTDGTTGGDPARAVDGVLSNTWPYCMKTSTNVGDDQANIFWTVDLGTTHDISNTVIWPRLDFNERLYRMEIYIGMNRDWKYDTRVFGPGSMCPNGAATCASGGSGSVTIPLNFRGRYLTVRRVPLVAPPPNDFNIINLCEIIVNAQLLLDQPSARSGATVTTFRGSLVVFGGTDVSGVRLSDVRFFDMVNKVWLPPSQPLGSSPSARAYGSLSIVPLSNPSTPSTELILFGGSGTVESLNDVAVLTFPTCPVMDTTGMSNPNCAAGGTTCFVVCIGGFTYGLPDGTPFVCQPDGTWNAPQPVCQPPLPTAPTGVTATALTTTETSGAMVQVNWAAPLSPGYQPLSSYRISVIDQGFTENFALGKFADASKWSFHAGVDLTSDLYYFANGKLGIDTQANGNCWLSGATSMECGALLRDFPTGIDPSGDWVMESYVSFDQFSTKQVVDGSMAGIGLWDKTETVIGKIDPATGKNWTGGIPEFYGGIRRNSGGYQVGWEAVTANWNYWQPVDNSITYVYVRLQRSAALNSYRMGWRFKLADVWAYTSWVASSRMRSGGMDTTQMKLMLLTRSWTGTSRCYGQFDYVRVSPPDCADPGPIRVVPATQTSVVLSNLDPLSKYKFVVEAANPYGYGPTSAASALATTAAAPPPSNPVNVSALVEVAVGKPSTQTSQYQTYVPSQCNDGNLNTICHTNNGVVTGEFWQVDLLRQTAIKEIAIWNRADATYYSRLDGFVVFVSDTPLFSDSAFCTDTPYSIPSTTTPIAYYARWNCSLVGRYLTVRVMPNMGSGSGVNRDGNLHFREIGVYATNSCPARTARNALQTPGTTCRAGATLGSVCTYQCQPGFIRTSGEETSTCNGDDWDAEPLVCEATCPDLPAPTYASGCKSSLYSEDFTNRTLLWAYNQSYINTTYTYGFNLTNTSVFNTTTQSWVNTTNVRVPWNVSADIVQWRILLMPYVDGSNASYSDSIQLARSKWISLEPNRQGMDDKWFILDGTLQAAASYGCTDNLHLVLGETDIYDVRGGFVFTSDVQTSDRAGIVFRVVDRQNYFRYWFDVFSGQHVLERVVGGNATTIITATMAMSASRSYVVSAIVEDGAINITIDGEVLLSTFDRTLVQGTAGVYARTTATFDDISFAIDCPNICSSSTPGAQCTFTCQDGLLAVGPSSRTCVADSGGSTASWFPAPNPTNISSQLFCTLPPPTFKDSTLTIKENSARNAAVGDPLIGYINSNDFQLQWQLEAQYPTEALYPAGLFYIDSCSGQVKLRTGGNNVIDFERTSKYLLQIRAYVPGFPLAEARRNITVNVLNVDESPSVVEKVYYLPENSAAGTLVGFVNVTDPEGDAVTITLDVDNANGKFRVLPNGLIVVTNASTALDFEATSAPFAIIVRATQTNGNPLTATGKIQIALTDRNDAPMVTPGAVVEILEAKFTTAYSAAAVIASVPTLDQDNAARGNFSSNLTYYLLTPTESGANADCRAQVVNNPLTYFYPSVDKSPTGTPIFAINPSTGALTAPNRPNPWLSDGTAYPPFSFNGDSRRIVYVLCVNITDGYGASTVSPLITTVTADIAGQPVALGLEAGQTGLFNTSGGNLRVVGYNFGVGSRPNYGDEVGQTGTNPMRGYLINAAGRRLNLTACFTNVNKTQCTVPAGSGSGYTVYYEVKVNLGAWVPVIFPTPIVVSYMPPTVTRLDFNKNLATGSPTNVTFWGYNLGKMLDDDATAIYVGTQGTTITKATKEPGIDCVMQKLTSSANFHLALKCTMPPYWSTGWGWTLWVGGQYFNSDASMTIDYTPPVFSGPQTPNGVFAYTAGCPGQAPACARANYSLNALDTAGGQILQISGGGFGATSPVTGYYGDLQFEWCQHGQKPQDNPAAILYCKTVAGVGSGRKVTIQVGNQKSVPWTGSVSYGAPTVTSVVTDGLMSTEGGQVITVLGTNFGPKDYKNSAGTLINQIDTLTYGHGGDVTRYDPNTLGACRVVSASRIDCTSVPGVGKDHLLRLAIGGQAAPDFAARLAYQPPAVYTFTGPGSINADTVGGQIVSISGRNFGPNDAYTNQLLDVTYGTPIVGGPGNITSVKYVAAQCGITSTGHYSMQCQTAEGAGAALSWTVKIDGQVSVQPTTAYAAPVVDSITLIDPSTSNVVTNANVNGGTIAKLGGRFFGPPSYNNSGKPLVQSVTYGINGDEYIVPKGSWTLNSHYELVVPLLAGAGQGLRFKVSVADQTSKASDAVFNFAVPVIVALTPSHSSTFSDDKQPTLITVNTRNLPLKDPKSIIKLSFGVPNYLRDIAPILPAGAALARATQPDGSVNIAFALPSDGAGLFRAVQLYVWSTDTGAEVDRSDVTMASLFNYDDPVVYDTIVTKARFGGDNDTANSDSIACPFPAGSTLWECDNPAMMQLTLEGINFGKCNAASGICDNGAPAGFDGVTKTIERLMFNSSITGELWSQDAIWISSWSHTRIVAFSATPTGFIRLRLLSKAYDGTSMMQTIIREYRQDNPEIGSITGGKSNIPTTGSTTDPIILEVYNLANGNTIEVWVGNSKANVRLTCGGYTGTTVTDLINQQLNANGYGAPVLICADVPAGQGSQAKVILYRYSSGGWSGSNTGFYVSYRKPLLTGIEVWKGGVLTSTIDPGAYGARVVVPTDGSAVLRVKGTDLGYAPTITMGDGVISGQMDDQGNATGPLVVACPGTVGTHTCYQVQSVAGEGTGRQYLDYSYMNGYILRLDAGDQSSVNVGYSYEAPVVTSVVNEDTGVLPTAGGVMVTLLGSNFGEHDARRVDVISAIKVQFFRASSAASTMECENPIRISHFQINCTLPEGSGRSLSVSVQVVDITGTSAGVFSYDPPSLAKVTLIPSTSWNGSCTPASGADLDYALMMVDAEAGQNVSNPTVPGAITGAPGASLPLLSGSTAGGDVIVLFGSNFGVSNASVHCAFMPWTFRSTPNGAELTCDGKESFVGEGEVASYRVISWSHNRVAFCVPPGLGTKDIEVSIRGSTFGTTVPRTNARTPHFRYAAPVLTSLDPALPDTEGGEVGILTGANFGVAPRNSTASMVLTDFPLEQAASLPTAHLVVVYHRTCLATPRLLLSSPVSLPVTTWFGTKNMNDCDAHVTSITHNAIVFRTGSGIGKNRIAQVMVVEDVSGFPAALPLITGGQSQVDSNRLYFSYQPPTISSYSPSVVYLAPDELPEADFDIFGRNFGNEELSVIQQWGPDELAKSGKVGGIDCLTVKRRREVGDNGLSETILSCGMAAAGMPAGYRNVTVQVAGQVGFKAEAPPSRALLLVCATGYYGHMNETCVACPAQSDDPNLRGAECKGYMPSVAKLEDRFTYPRPLKGWYNLNSTDRYVVQWGAPGESMLTACPDGYQDHGRDVCIVPCDPPESCLGDNNCAYGYTSKSPMWRCSSCDKGFYKRAGECIKCPDSPAALFIGFAFLVAAVAGIGFLLNKRQVNIAVISIGVDFFQVLAIFSQTRVKWPPVVKELLHVLSAFNLNIEIVAPECLIPDVSYQQKFWFIMLLPLSVGFLLLMTFLIMVFNKACIKGREKKRWFSHSPTLVSSTLVLVYMLYLYLTRTILDVFNCTPTMPPDGYTYLQVVFERCGVPGGTQLTLLPYAIAGLVVYTFGYPAFIGYTLYKNRELVMEDQLLRAKGVGNDRLSNPHAYGFRKMFGRAYFQFKPDRCLWIVMIVIRKFFIALTAVIFNKNSSFQMAACLLVMFIAYSLQMSARPYMSPGEFEEVLRSHAESSYTSAIHARLRSVLANIETRGRKKVRKNLLNFNGKIDRNAIFGILSGWLFNYNTVEQIMIFAAVIVCLMGIMYQANEVNTYYPESKDSVTAVVLAVIILAILYFITVLVTEIVVLYNEQSRMRQLAKQQAKGKGEKGKGEKGKGGSEGDGKRSSGKLVGDDGEINVGKMDTQMNPLFMNAGGNGANAIAGDSIGLDAIMAQRTSPPPELWSLFQQSFGSMASQVTALQEQLAEAKKAAQLQASGVGRSSSDLNDGEADSGMAHRPARKAAFGPVNTSDGSSSGSNPLAAVRGASSNKLGALRASASKKHVAAL